MLMMRHSSPDSHTWVKPGWWRPFCIVRMTLKSWLSTNPKSAWSMGTVTWTGDDAGASADGIRLRWMVVSSPSSGLGPGRAVSTVKMSALISTVVLGKRLYWLRWVIWAVS